MKASHAKLGLYIACGGGAGEIIAIDGKRLCFRDPEDGVERWVKINDCQLVPSPAELKALKMQLRPHWEERPLGASA